MTSGNGEDPTGKLPRDDSDPTEPVPAAEPATDRHPEPSGEDPTERMAERPGDDPTARLAGSDPEPRHPAGAEGSLPGDRSDDGRRLGFVVLAGSILAALVLCGGYIALGGLDYRPAGAADPCAPRAWGSPQGLEQTAERFSLAAIDGAACELGVTREELTRALASEDSRNAFADDHGITDGEIEEAVRAGLLRATDDAERGGSLSAVAATGARLAIKVMPMSVMVSLIDNASDLFSSGLGSGLGDALGGALDLLGPGTENEPPGEGGGTSPGSAGAGVEELPGKIGRELTDRLREQLPDGVRQAVPDDLGSQVEKGLNDLVTP